MTSLQPDSNSQIRPATGKDLDAILRIQESSAGVASWSRESCREALAESSRYEIQVAEVEGQTVAFALTSLVAGESELLNIAVAPEHWRQGLAALLLARVVSRVPVVHLEVRATNEPAINLYKRAGFKSSGRRKNYYRDPPDDALLMRFDRR